jgi:prophage maintenance system killer protein
LRNCSESPVDGNKRTGWVVARLFAQNGYILTDPHDAVRTIERLASGKLSEPRLVDWFRQKTVKS